MEQAQKIRSPLLVLAGGRDHVSPREHLTIIQERVRSQGMQCDLVIYEDDTHGLTLHREEVYARLLSFLARFGP